MKPDKSLTDYQRQVYQNFLDHLSKEAEQKAKEGFFPYAGQWRRIEEIRNYQRGQKRRDRDFCIELILLFLLLIIFSMAGLSFFL